MDATDVLGRLLVAKGFNTGDRGPAARQLLVGERWAATPSDASTINHGASLESSSTSTATLTCAYDCGRNPGYFNRRLDELHALALAAKAAGSRVCWG